jgi:glutamate-5-semialdehyde dehydrogenase
VSIHQHVTELATSAKQASASLANSPVSVRNAALQAIALQVKVSKTALLAANAEDLLSAKKKGLDLALIDRLELTDARIEAMLTSLSIVQALPDPIGGVEDLRAMASGIQVGKMRVPLGLIGIIYESRPNVTIDAASLCLKSGNAVLLRGGSEAIRSNLVLATCIKAGLTEAGLSEELVQVIDTTDRAAVSALVGLSGLVDMVVPRGGKGLIERVAAEATVPVLKHLDGICHLYIHSKADVSMATELTVN